MNLLLAHLCIAAVTLTTGGLIPLLIWLLIMSLCVWAVFLVLGMLPLPSPVKQIAFTSSSVRVIRAKKARRQFWLQNVH